MLDPISLDFGSSLHYALALLPEIVLTLAASILLLVDVFQRGSASGPSRRSIGWMAVAGVGAAAVANLWLLVLEPAGSAGMVALDDLRVAANFLILGGAFFGLLFSFDYLERESLQIGEFHALVLLSAVGMMLLAGAQDLILVFLGLEMMSLPIYVLTAFDRRSPRSAEAGLKYFLVGAFATAFFVYGIAAIYGATGSTHLLAMAPLLGEAVEAGHPLVLAGVGLLLVGFGFKVAAVPFHMWAPDAYEGAPTPVTGFMAAAVKAAGFLALIRVVGIHLDVAREIWEPVLWWLAVLTMVVPNLIALAQDDVKRMLAYSSVAHAGYVLVGLTAGGEPGRAAALFYLAVYTIMTLGAFGVLYLVAGQGDRRSHLDDFRGLGWRRPVMGAALVLFLVSLAGFPPTGGFVGKLFLLRAAVDGGQLVLAVTLVLTSLVAYYYYLRVVWKMYFEEAPAIAGRARAPGAAFRFATLACAVGVLASGLLPGPGIRGAERAAFEPQRAAVVEDGPSAAAPSEPPRAAVRAGEPQRETPVRGDSSHESGPGEGSRGGGS